MKKRLQALRNEEGLTLVELLAVIVILAIIAVVAFVMIGQVIENSKKDAHIANAQQMIASAKIYEAQNGEFAFAFAPVASLDVAAGTGVDGKVTLKELQAAGSIDKIYDSWTKKEIDPADGDKSAFVQKSGNEYTVTLPAEGGKCNISGTSEDKLAAKDARKKLCGDSTSGGSGEDPSNE